MTSAQDWRAARSLAHAAGSAVPRRPETLSLEDAFGCVLAKPLVARTGLPGFDTAAMDGYAVAGPGPWRVVGRVLAGEVDDPRLDVGCAVEVATGAAVPRGTDAVIAYEQSVAREGAVSGEVRPGRHIRRAGEEITSGAQLVPAGRLVTSAVISLAAAVGHDALAVQARPRVHALITGDELVSSGLPPVGFVRDAIGPALPSMLASSGAEVSAVERLPDGLSPLLGQLESVDADLVIVSGSSSVGIADHLEKCLYDLGAQPIVASVVCAPGRTQSLWRLADGRLLVGLPGNPLAAIVAYLTLVDPVCAGIVGRELPLPATVGGCDVRPHPTRTRLVPVTVSGDRALACGYVGSAMLRGVADADALAVIEPDTAGRIDLLPLPGGLR